MDIFLAVLLVFYILWSSPKGAVACAGHALVLTAFLGAITAIHIYG
ncbi:hypothetical protein [Acinetobacter baumannii]|nr:hypothetical protein [Acinetobacter baumannii]MDE5410541.1 hypothetical protein [Acinetobacter baumannii]